MIPHAINPINFIRPYLAKATLVITAARTPGKKSPLLIDEESLKFLPEHAVIIDLATSNGGNVSGTQSEKTITGTKNVLIRSVSGYPKMEPKTSSEIYAHCIYSLIIEIMSSKGEVSFNNPLVQEIWVTHNKRRRDSLYDEFEEIPE